MADQTVRPHTHDHVHDAQTKSSNVVSTELTLSATTDLKTKPLYVVSHIY